MPNYRRNLPTLGGGYLEVNADTDSGVISIVEFLTGGQGGTRKFEVLLSNGGAKNLHQALGKAIQETAHRKKGEMEPRV